MNQTNKNKEENREENKKNKSENQNQETISEKEQKTREFWKKIKLLTKLQEKRKNSEKYFLLDGPPYANYVPHVGHIRNTVYKDLYIRWEFMKGKQVLFQPGFDTHGLPIENMVEKKLNLESKKDIEKLGIKKFMKTCKESAAINKDLWMETYDLLGSWYSWKKPYLTYENNYIESTWWSFKKIFDNEMAYEGKKPVFWCPKCETALAGYETTDSYKNVTDPSIYIKFQLRKEKDTFLLVYTTTPWTLPANAAIFIAPKEDYVKVQTKEHGKLILAKKRIELLKELKIDYEIIEEFKGEKIVGEKYHQILDVPSQKELETNDKALRVYASVAILKERVGSKVAAKKGIKKTDIYEDFVTVEEGTGLVHCAPGHGKTDSEVGKQFGIPAISPVNDRGELTSKAGKFQGKFVKDADHEIAEELNKTKRLLHYGKIEHSYPLCWRCKSPLIYRLSNQWFLKIEPIKEKMLKANEKVNWQPDFAKERFSHWVANAEDWNFSRQRYWGIPIPIWKGKSGKTTCIGSEEELRKLSTTKLPEEFDLHTVNDVTIKDPETNEEMKRINDIFDVWYDSGSAPYAALHYPFENKELFEEHFPISRINESQDQIRGWFYSLMFCGVATFDKAPFKTISMPGWVLDEKGEKMSKSLGNVVFAKDALQEFGADAIRLYYCWDIGPQHTQKFSIPTIKNDIRRIFSIWRNLKKLAETQETQFSAKEIETKKEKYELEDKWLISRLNSTIKEVKENIENFELHLAGRSISKFIMDDLSRTYIQTVRDRLEKEETPKKLLCYTLYQTAKLTSAITPHISEEIYLAIKEKNTDEKEESVHLETLPKTKTENINKELEEEMNLANEVIASILSARDKARIGVRWPLSKAHVNTEDEKTINAMKTFEKIILKQTNIKTISTEKVEISFDGNPNYQTLGKTFGQETGNAATTIKENKEKIIKEITSKDKKCVIDNFEFLPEHINLEKIIPKEYSAGEFKKGSTYLETRMTRELEVEGFSREITRRLQQLRKEIGLTKEDKIKAEIEIEMAQELEKYSNEIKTKVGAEEIIFSNKEITKEEQDEYEHKKEVNVRDKKLTIKLSKI